jgi:hypothetical protein
MRGLVHRRNYLPLKILKEPLRSKAVLVPVLSFPLKAFAPWLIIVVITAYNFEKFE